MKHPSFILWEIIDRYGSGLSFEFSHYIYTPRSIDDQRSIFKIHAKELSENAVQTLLSSIPDNAELALNSRVHFDDGKMLHIPMVDLSARVVGVVGKVLDVLPAPLAKDMLWFESGRSFHGYGINLLTYQEWIQIMGRLLLANLPQQPPIVDPRWVGHRLIAGYSALRWSKNTNNYIQMPQLVKNVHLIRSRK